jgi:exosortase K
MINKTARWFCITVMTAITIKYLHTISTTDNLIVILRPASALTEWLLDTRSVLRESGFYFAELNRMVDKSATAVHFFLVAFLVLSCTTPYHLLRTMQSIFLFFVSLLTAYVLTVITITLKMALSLWEPSGTLLLITSQPFLRETIKGFVYLSIIALAYHLVKPAIMRFGKKMGTSKSLCDRHSHHLSRKSL